LIIQLTKFTDSTLEKPFRLVEAKVEEVSLYVGKWLQFQSLWDIEAEQVYNVSIFSLILSGSFS